MNLGLEGLPTEEIVIEIPELTMDDVMVVSEYVSMEKDISTMQSCIGNLIEMRDILSKHGMHQIVTDMIGPQLDPVMPGGIKFADANLEQATEGITSAIVEGVKKLWDFLVKVYKAVIKAIKKMLSAPILALKKMVRIEKEFNGIDDASFRIKITFGRESLEDPSVEAIMAVNAGHVMEYANYELMLRNFWDFITFIKVSWPGKGTSSKTGSVIRSGFDPLGAKKVAKNIGVDYDLATGKFSIDVNIPKETSKLGQKHSTLEQYGWDKNKALKVSRDVTALLKSLSARTGVYKLAVDNLDETNKLINRINSLTIAKDSNEALMLARANLASKIPDFSGGEDSSDWTPFGGGSYADKIPDFESLDLDGFLKFSEEYDKKLIANAQKWANTLATMLIVIDRVIRYEYVGILENVLHICKEEKIEHVEGRRAFW